MSVRSAQSITKVFTLRRFDTGAAANGDSLPTGTLYVNGTADAASVTVTNLATGVYKSAVTLPTLAAGDLVDLRIAATVNAISDNGIIWWDTKDLALDSSYRPGIDWANVGAPTTTLALTGTTISTSQVAASVTAPVTTTDPTAAVIADAVWDEARSGHTTSGTFGEYVNANVTYVNGVAPGGGGLSVSGGSGPKSVLSSLTTYLPAAEFLKRCDHRTTGDLCSDADSRVSAANLLTNDNLTAALQDASGLVESAALVGGRYTPDDINALAGNGLRYLYRLITIITRAFLVDRRPTIGVPMPVGFDWAMNQLQLLREGQRIFSFSETADAGLPAHHEMTPDEVETRRLTTIEARNLYGTRSNQLGTGL